MNFDWCKNQHGTSYFPIVSHVATFLSLLCQKVQHVMSLTTNFCVTTVCDLLRVVMLRVTRSLDKSLLPICITYSFPYQLRFKRCDNLNCHFNHDRCYRDSGNVQANTNVQFYITGSARVIALIYIKLLSWHISLYNRWSTSPEAEGSGLYHQYIPEVYSFYLHISHYHGNHVLLGGLQQHGFHGNRHVCKSSV